MNLQKRRKKYLSTIRTARSLSALFILVGFLLLIAGITVSTLLVQTDISGKDVTTLLDSLDTGGSNTNVGNTEASATVPGTVSAENKKKIRIWIDGLLWEDLWRILAASLLILWLGYVLRILATLAETQLVDFQSTL